MKPYMRTAQAKLETLLASHDLTTGMYIRIHGENLIMGRDLPCGQDEELEPIDSVRLTRRNASSWGLSVKRHTGRWERTPFSGSMNEMIDVIRSLMQHLVAP